MHFKIKHITNTRFAYKRILDTKCFPIYNLELNLICYYSIYKN